MLTKLTKLVAVASLAISSCIPTLGTVLAKESEAAPQHVVSLTTQGTTYTFGNDYLKRVFTNTDGVLKTKELINYRAGSQDTPKTLTPVSSEEFVIKTMPTIIKGQTSLHIDNKVGTGEGNLDYVIDGSTAEGNFWASKNAEDHANDTELAVEIDLGSEKDVKSMKYVPRYARSQPDNGYQCVGRVEKARVYYYENNQWKQVADQVYTMNLNAATTITFNQVIKTNKIKFVAVETYHWQDGTGGKPNNRNKVMSVAELDVFDTNAHSLIDRDRSEQAKVIKASELKLVGEPTLTDENNIKTATFTFEPKMVNGIEYRIQEILTMKDGESFMRKRLAISVPEGQATSAKIDYIDLENMKFQDLDVVGKIGDKNNNYWTIPDQPANPHMANQDGKFLELGQPYYVGAMYWGCEFPEAENKIRDKNGFVRYHFGKSLAVENTFEHYNNYNGSDGINGKMVTWDAVVGAARSTDYSVYQADFYEYIETIATETNFRQQFNSWYDNMKDITAENIKSSFYEVEKGFTQYGVNPLDSYVVDDGWINYNSFWDFDRRASKFPNELYDSSLQVNQLNSNFGLWLGPRGGYGTERTIANWIANNNLGSVNERSGNDINVSDARYLNKLRTDIFLGYQDKFDINYWKLDGMLLRPSHRASDYYVTGNDLYTVSETYERWTDIYEDMRENRGDKDLWINMTSYTNPSPWHLQWVNSVWMQNTGDTGFDWNFNASDQQRMLTYRDNCYYEFFNDRQWQLPNKYFYNHDPVYAKTAHRVDGRHPGVIHFSTEELREHLYMLGTRGTAFWEYYYSPEMFDADKWQVNAESANWIQENFNILEKSQMFGGKPSRGEIYGYSCWNGNEGIVSLRNPSNQRKTIEVTYDRLIGVPETLSNVYGKVVIGNLDKYQNNTPLNYNDKVTFTLEPQEVLIMQYGAKDETAATVKNISVKGNTVDVEFNETLRTVTKDMFTVEGNEVKEAVLNADLRTVTLTLNNKLEPNGMITVHVDGVKDVAQNTTTTTVTDDYYENDVVTSIVNRTLDGKPITKGDAASIDGSKGFSITGRIKTTSKNVELVRQKDAFTVSIDAQGYLNFNFKGVNVNSKYDAKTRQDNGNVISETKGLLADGVEHQFSAVKEVNGMIKLYIDGNLVASEYDEKIVNPELSKAEVVFADGLKGETKFISVVDRALAYDEVASFIATYENVALSRNNSKVEISAYDVTAQQAVAEKDDRPFRYLNDGNKDYPNNYLELNDTADGKKHVRYVQLDLGGQYSLDKFFLQRYSDNRKYGPTAIVLSNDANFEQKEVVFNTDQAGNVLNLGKGSDALYQETREGKTVTLEAPVTARYIRIYVNGNTTASTSDHLVEFEAYGTSLSGAESELQRIDYTRLETLVNADLSAYTEDSIKAYQEAAANTLEKANDLLEKKNATSDAQVSTLVEKLLAHRELLIVKAEQPLATVHALSLSLADYIGVNYYFDFSDAVLNDANAYVEFTREDQSTVKYMISQIKENTKVVDGKTLYRATVPMAARQMMDIIDGKVILGNKTEIELVSTSVQDYAKVILENKDNKYSAQAVAAVKAMLNYGTAAQMNFKNKVDQPANAILSEEDRNVVVDDREFAQYKSNKEGSVTGLDYFGTSVLLRSKTGFAHYFTLTEGNIADYTFTMNGQPLEVKEKEGKYYVEVNNIYAKDLANAYTVKVSKGEETMSITFGVFAYANVVVNGQYWVELNAVVRSLYPYFEAALAY